MLTTNVGNAHGAGCHVPGGAAAPQTPHLFIFLVGKLDKNSPTLSAGWHAGCRSSIGGSRMAAAALSNVLRKSPVRTDSSLGGSA